MKKAFSFLVVLMCLLVSIILIGCRRFNLTIKLNANEVILCVGESYQVMPTVENGTENYEFDYEVVDQTIIENNNGLLKALKAGQTNIIISVKGNDKIDDVIINVIVNEITATSILTMTELYLSNSEVYQMTWKVAPEKASQEIIFTSSNPEIVSVSKDGLLAAVGVGEATITMVSKANQEVTKEVNVIVESVDPADIETKKEVSITIEEEYQIIWEVTPKGASQEVEFESSNNSILEVDEEGCIKPKKIGKAFVYVTSKEDSSIRERITVEVTKVLVEEIQVFISEISLSLGESADLSYKVLPEDANQEVDFVYDDTALLIENNKVTALKAGTFLIDIVALDKGQVKNTITVTIEGSSTPQFIFSNTYKSDLYLNWGKPFDEFMDVSVYDAEDGLLNSKVELNTRVDNTTYGVYNLVYKVTDSDGNQATLERTVTVGWNYDVSFIGHAGSYYGIMNTEEAILYAAQVLKYQAIEVDLKQTKDGVFILCHDDNFGDYTLSAYTWDQLKDVEVTSSRNAGYPSQNGSVKNSPYTAKLCTLERYLEICKQYNCKAVIELKYSNGISNDNQSRMKDLMNEIEKAGMRDNVILLGSQYNSLIWTRKNGYSDIECQYLVSSCESDTYLQRCIDNDLDISINVTGNYSNSEEWLAKYKEAGLKISTYTYTQYVNYDVVQEWIDKGVDYVTCDWHVMSKLDLPESSSEPKQQYTVKFYDNDKTLLKETTVEEEKAAPAPSVKDKNGYEFIGWDKDLKNITQDMEFTALYKPIVYSINYSANADTITESSWATKADFVSDFYSDLFDWISENASSISGLTVSNGIYKLTRNSVTVSFASGDDIKGLDVYDFEKTISNLMYKPVTRDSEGKCVIVADEEYFLNSNKYRVKYQGVDQWLYKCIKQSYTAYDTTYTPTSSGKIQIFFRMHQWMNGTAINAFNNYPIKYEITSDQRVDATLPTTPLTYTVLDEIILPEPVANVKFLGWYLNSDCSGEKVTKIKKGTIGDISLYAKWELE